MSAREVDPGCIINQLAERIHDRAPLFSTNPRQIKQKWGKARSELRLRFQFYSSTNPGFCPSERFVALGSHPSGHVPTNGRSMKKEGRHAPFALKLILSVIHEGGTRATTRSTYTWNRRGNEMRESYTHDWHYATNHQPKNLCAGIER